MAEVYANSAQTTLNGSITSGAASLVVTAATAFPGTGNFRIIIDSELIIVGAVASTTFSSLTRGAEGTTAAAHTSGATITHVLTATGYTTGISDRITTHEGLADPHTGYRLESADHTHASTGLQGGPVSASDITTGTLPAAQSGGDPRTGGLTGATAATRFVGGTAAGPPTTGTFAIGDFVVDQSGSAWYCTAAGTPGTWTTNALQWPMDYAGFLAWNADPMFATNTFTLVSQTRYAVKIPIKRNFTAANLWCDITTLGSGFTNYNGLGLYNSSGTQVGTCADQATPWASTGVKSAALTVVGGQSLALVAGTYVYVEIMSSGTTPASLARFTAGAGAGNANLAGANLRWGTEATAQTALPASFTPSALTTNNITLWAAIS